ncbi:MAG: ArnT family glycosyltransferase [Fluviicola sp.]
MFGILTIFITVLLLLGAFWSQRRSNYTLTLLLLIGAGAMLRFFVISDPVLHPWDERYHALVAKNVSEHPLKPTLYENPVVPYQYKAWASNHVWLHKQPLPLWTLSASISVFGTNEFAVRFPSVVLSLLGVVIIYFFGKRLFNLRVGFYAAFFFTINGWILEMVAGRAPTDHVDVFFCFFILLGAYLAYRFTESRAWWMNLLCGVAIGLAILCKWLPALIVVPIWLMFALQYKFRFKDVVIHGSILVLTILLIALPWQLFIHSNYPLEAAWESHYNVLHFYEVLEGQSRPWYFHLDVMRVSYGELVYIPLFWFITRSIQLKSNFKIWALVIWVVIPFLFFTISATKMQSYTIFAAPALFLITAYFISELIDGAVRIPYKWLKYALIGLLVLLPVRYTYERVKPFSTKTEPQWRVAMEEFKQSTSPTARTLVFNTPHSIEYMFYTDATAYPTMPANYTLDSLQKIGYTIYCIESKDAPVKWKGLEGR